LRPREIARRITAAGIPISRRIAAQLLKRHQFVRRQSQKKKSFKQHPDRNAQFERIAQLKHQYLAAGAPVISVDTKKKELLGNFYRNGKLYTRETLEVLDHDFPSYSEGKIVPHGVYDIAKNKGHVNLGTSCDTTEFACDSVARWWETQGRYDHPQATQLLMLCDGGGSNPAGSSLFQQDLQTLANRTGLALRVAHYSPYCSKHNPIEHLLFPHITRACEGVVFESVPLVKQLIERTQTSTGLRVTVDIINRVYETGRKAAEHLKASLKIVFDPIFPQMELHDLSAGRFVSSGSYFVHVPKR
jgi:Rhodopirellula transposase DDE domain